MTNNLSTKTNVIRSIVELKSDYHDYRDILRFDFWFSCAYCTLFENEPSGIGFEIDHYYPKSLHPQLTNDYYNLIWSCRHCNQHKSNFSPSAAQVSQGYVILRPDQDDPSEHFEIENYDLKGKSKTGEFNIEKLNLNRQPLRRLREIRKRFCEAERYITFGIYYLTSIRLDLINNPKQRLLFSKIRQKVAEKYDEVSNIADELIRDLARSPLLDADAEKRERAKKRKEYLKGQNIIGIAPTIIKTKKKPK